MAEEVELRIDGRTYSGWETVTVFRTIEAVCGSFSLELSDAPGSWNIQTGARSQLLLDGVPFATGWIESVRRSLDKTSDKIAVEGRDLACDLVDCSAQLDAGEIWDVRIDDVAALLSEPYRVEVQFGADVNREQVFQIVAVNPGEGAWECLEKCLRMRGLLAFSLPTGAVLVTRPAGGDPVATIAEGENMKSGDVSRDDGDRFRNYLVTTQRKGNDEDDDAVELFGTGSAEDLGAREGRTLIIQAEQASDQDACVIRAQWEAATRAARSLQVGVSVAGWRRPGGTTTRTTGRTGPLWNVNERVRVRSPRLRIDDVLVVASCRYRLSRDGGRVTELGLLRPDAFIPEPVVPVVPEGLLGLDEIEN